MLFWIFLIIDVFFGIAVGLHMGATPLGIALFGGMAFVLALLISLILMAFLSLLLGRSVQKVPSKTTHITIEKITDKEVIYNGDEHFSKSLATAVVYWNIPKPYMEIVEYKAGGWRGFWFWDLYTYPKEYYIYLPLEYDPSLPFLPF